MSLTGADQRITLYSGSTTFTDITASLCRDGVSWVFSDLHFIEGNDYIIDSSSIEIVPLVTDITAGNLNRGTVNSVSIKNESNKFTLQYAAQSNKSFTYSNPESFIAISGTDCYLKASGTSTYKGSYFYELLASYDYYVEWQVNFKYQGEMDNENEEVIPEIDMESKISGIIRFEIDLTDSYFEFNKSNDFSIGSEIHFAGPKGNIFPYTNIETDDNGEITKVLACYITDIYNLDLVPEHEYRIEGIHLNEYTVSPSYTTMDIGSLNSLEILGFNVYRNSNTFSCNKYIPEACLLTSEDLVLPFYFNYYSKIIGTGEDLDGVNTLKGKFLPHILVEGAISVTDITKEELWEENHPEEEYPEGELWTPGSDGSLTPPSSGTNLSPITDKIDSSTQKITDKIDTAATVITGEIQASSRELKQELEEQTNIVAGKLDEQKQELEEQTTILEEQKENEKNFFDGFFENLIESIKGLFVPSQEEMEALLNELMTFFSEKFGFLFYPFELLGQALQIFTQDSSTALTFPSFSIMGYEVWPDLTYDITENEIANTVFTYVRYATGAMLAMWFINYLRNFFDKRFGGGGN